MQLDAGKLFPPLFLFNHRFWQEPPRAFPDGNQPLKRQVVQLFAGKLCYVWRSWRLRIFFKFFH
ncbi:MAG: hypothetical protein A2Z90_09770 [Burkholderiales bacterium GWA2_64_37]|nr:MAG: hypothetical protein A2Z90_09770 [Burkholderiales bacterium GWA2_64_37]HCE92730.1 hypothetical protein [Acidovorax sp.]